MAQRSTNTMAEVLQRFLGDIAQAKVLMDADLPFLLSLETMIVDKLRDPVKRMEEQGLLPPGSSMNGGGGAMGMGGGMGGPPPMPPQSPPTQIGGLMPSPAAPNADELRRLLNQGQ
jgi:hypothetical protein